MKSDSEVVQVTTLPFLLQLASMSQTLLQVLTADQVLYVISVYSIYRRA